MDCVRGLMSVQNKPHEKFCKDRASLFSREDVFFLYPLSNAQCPMM